METVARWSKFSTKWQGFMWLFFHDQFSKPRSKTAWTNANSCKVGNQNSGEISSTVWDAVDERKGLENFTVDKNYLFPQTGEFFPGISGWTPSTEIQILGRLVLKNSSKPTRFREFSRKLHAFETMIVAFWRGSKCHFIWNALNLLWLRDETPRTFADDLYLKEIQFLDEMLLAIPYSRLTYEVDKVQPSQNSSCFALTWGFKTLTWHSMKYWLVYDGILILAYNHNPHTIV